MRGWFPNPSENWLCANLEGFGFKLGWGKWEKEGAEGDGTFYFKDGL